MQNMRQVRGVVLRLETQPVMGRFDRAELRYEELLKGDAQQWIHEQRHQHQSQNRATIAQDFAQLFEREPHQALQAVVRVHSFAPASTGPRTDSFKNISTSDRQPV